jgi:hypothetical protein
MWKTVAGKVQSTHKVTIQFSLPEFYESTVIQYDAHVFQNDISYDLIISRDLMRQLGIKIDLETNQVGWEDASIPRKSPDCTTKDFYTQDAESIKQETTRIQRILDAKYESADLKQIVRECTHLNSLEQQKL